VKGFAMAQIDIDRNIVAGIIRDCSDRVQACNAYLKQYPKDEYSQYTHVVVGDDNVDDYWLYSAISKLSEAICNDEQSADLLRQFRFIVGLLDLPLPDGWDDDEYVFFDDQ
jgi:hypothetical protein